MENQVAVDDPSLTCSADRKIEAGITATSRKKRDVELPTEIDIVIIERAPPKPIFRVQPISTPDTEPA